MWARDKNSFDGQLFGMPLCSVCRVLIGWTTIGSAAATKIWNDLFGGGGVVFAENTASQPDARSVSACFDTRLKRF